jgi:hypothetical protein
VLLHLPNELSESPPVVSKNNLPLVNSCMKLPIQYRNQGADVQFQRLCQEDGFPDFPK